MIDFNIDNYLRISLTDVVLVCISTFLIVMFAKKFFWEKLLTLIQKRQDLIQENIDSSVAIKKQAEDVKEQYDEKLRNVSQEAHTILVSARAHADQEKQQIIKEANDEDNLSMLTDTAEKYLSRIFWITVIPSAITALYYLTLLILRLI